ncbi:hypothetical protein [Clostridium tarantellae]|uniref:DUF1129 family protein n=1 Tax=Clostridium tarantellae TaxID=39493 RepID=A0A6I1MLQ2_9CLOT|nr:hypothetical protein [Clostridium tarantellae]MPQ43663.1 hypothetical protein [Clostridium tarantellae]
MTKDEKKYHKELYKKLDPDYKEVYGDLTIRLSYATFCSINAEEILIDVLEMFYNHQLMGEPVEKVVGKNKEIFFNEIIKSYYEEKVNKLSLIKNIVWISTLFTSGCMILSFMQKSTTILTLVAMPIGFLLTLIGYFVNRYVNNRILRYILTYGTIGIFMTYLVNLMKEYKSLYPLSKFNFIIVILILIIITILSIKKNYADYSKNQNNN